VNIIAIDRPRITADTMMTAKRIAKLPAISGGFLWHFSGQRRGCAAGGSPALGEDRVEPRLSHDFARLPVYPAAIEATNGVGEEDAIHKPQIEKFRQSEGGLGNPAATEMSDAAIKYRGLGASCPASTEVERVVDMTPAALSSGFLTAYGVMAVMRVRPGERTWDGTKIQESLTTVSKTCPASFSPTPECSGDSTFTVGDPGRSSRIGNQPGLVNRFYDFHASGPRGVSRLHDNSRNPQGLNSCETVCEQKYHCDGREIGRHTVTRTFTKGTFGGRDVTLVAVTKK
jgi:hypothetical protein